MRRFVVGLLIVVSALSLLLSSTSLWVRRNVINTGVFVSNVETLVHLPQVEARINDRVTTTVMAAPEVQDAINQAVSALPDRLQQFRPTVADGVRSLVSAGVQRILTREPFRPVTEAALTSAHTQLVNGQPVRFTLGQAKALVPASAQDGLAGQVIALVPNDVGVTLLTPADAPQVYNALDLLESVWLWAGLLALATLAGALGVSRHRRGTLRAWSVTTLVLGLLLLVALRVARGPLLTAAKPENRDAVGAIYDVLAASLRSWTLWVVGFALVVLVFTLLWGRLGLVAAVRRGVWSARAQVQRQREERRLARASGAGETGEEAGVAVPSESWPRRIAAESRAFVEGMDLPRRVVGVGGFVRAHLAAARWTGIVAGVLVLLFWPSPTLSVLIWIGALVALWLVAVDWLQNQAPDAGPAAPAPGPEAEPAPTAPVPAAAAPVTPADGPLVPDARTAPDRAPTGVLVAAPPGERGAEPQPGAPAPPPPEVLSPDRITTLSGRLDLLVRLGAVHDAGVLTDQEFDREKERLLAL